MPRSREFQSAHALLMIETEATGFRLKWRMEMLVLLIVGAVFGALLIDAIIFVFGPVDEEVTGI